jgi:hypothetical protein
VLIESAGHHRVSLKVKLIAVLRGLLLLGFCHDAEVELRKDTSHKEAKSKFRGQGDEELMLLFCEAAKNLCGAVTRGVAVLLVGIHLYVVVPVGGNRTLADLASSVVVGDSCVHPTKFLRRLSARRLCER